MPRDRRLDPSVERRASKRYGIQQDLTYRILGSRTQEAGSGQSINFSSSGLLFRTQGPSLHKGDRLEVSVIWPALLSGTCPLKFVAQGRVVRVEDRDVAIEIGPYEFRTRRAAIA
ncbi:MAG: PilZ domain-containing protein [Bryobacteraceae bacterium]